MFYFLEKTKLESSAINFLKLLAIFFMCCDHIGKVLLNENQFFIALGRIAFPLFAFVLVHNYLYYTSNKKKFILRLTILGVISQPFFVYCLDKEIYQLNIFFTLSLGLSLIYFFETFVSLKECSLEKGIAQIFTYFCMFFISIFVDYSIFGVIVIILCYFHFERQRVIYERLLFFTVVAMNIAIPIVSFYALFFVPLVMIAYQQEEFKIKNINKWFFYSFYPLHLLILFLIKTFLI